MKAMGAWKGTKGGDSWTGWWDSSPPALPRAFTLPHAHTWSKLARGLHASRAVSLMATGQALDRPKEGHTWTQNHQAGHTWAHS